MNATLTKENIYLKDHYLLPEGDNMNPIVFHIISPSISRLALEAVKLNIEIKGRGTLLTRKDSLASMNKIKNEIYKVVEGQRSNISMRYVTSDRIPLIELFGEKLHLDTLFNCSDSILTFVDEEHLPQNATRLDRGLVQIRPDLLSRDISIDNLITEVKKIVKYVQIQQLRDIKK